MKRLGFGFVFVLWLSACGSKGSDSSASAEPSAETPDSVKSGGAHKHNRGNGEAKASSEPAEPPAEDEQAEQADFGSRLDDKEFNNGVGVLQPGALMNPPGPTKKPPPSVLLDNLPTVQLQGTKKHWGSPGSCEAHSFGYGLGAFTAARDLAGNVLWDASKPENEPSTAFLYSWAKKAKNEKCGSGTMATPYLSYLVSTGAPSMADVPYKPDCSYLGGDSYVDKVFSDSPRLRIGSFGTFSINQNSGVLLKEMLASGHAVAFSGLVLKGYTTPTLTEGVLYGTDTIPKSGHGQLLVGYDDTKGTADKPGAFLVQNSAGPDWPPAAPGGRIWMAYDTFLASQKFGAVAYPKRDDKPNGATLKASSPTKGEAPVAVVEKAYEWDNGKNDVMVLMHYFAQPMLINSIEMTEPGGKTMHGDLKQFIQYGYTHFRRSDGKGWKPGKWKMVIEAENTEGGMVTYKGQVEVTSTKAGAPMDKGILGPTGKPATVK